MKKKIFALMCLLMGLIMTVPAMELAEKPEDPKDWIPYSPLFCPAIVLLGIGLVIGPNLEAKWVKRETWRNIRLALLVSLIITILLLYALDFLSPIHALTWAIWSAFSLWIITRHIEQEW